jgi:hypothetical protein
MTSASEGDIAVDVLVIGGGVPALYIARALHKQYSVCVIADPKVPPESFDLPGYLSAGYDGNDVARIQPARRAAGYWRLWAESNGVPHNDVPCRYVLPADEESMRTRLWSDATLTAHPAALPAVFEGGVLHGLPAYELEHDVVMNPAHMAATLTQDFRDRVIAAEIVRFNLITEHSVDNVEAETADGQSLSITPRYVVLAADVANGMLLQKLVTGFKDRARRKDALEAMRHCQAVRRQLVLAVRGRLPPVAGHFAGLDLTSFPFGTSGETVWLVAPPIDDNQTVLGPEDVRFPPRPDPAAAGDALGRLFDMAPDLGARREELRWGLYVARKTEHPMMATPDISGIGQPAPARMETFSMSTLVAVWPSHLSYAMVVGDVVAERAQQRLGAPYDFSDSVDPAELPHPSHDAWLARWERPDFRWSGWNDLAKSVGFPPG